MQVKKYGIGSQIIFEWSGSTQYGTITDVIIKKGKPRQYEVRAESGNMYPLMGVDTKALCGGRILSNLTDKIINKGLESTN